MQQLFYTNDFQYNQSSSIPGEKTKLHETSQKAIIRIFHAAPDLSELAVYVNAQPVAKKILYGKLTTYMEWEEGLYEIEVFHLVTKKRILFSRMALMGSEVYTLCITGVHTGLALLTESKSSLIKQNELAALTFVQLSPDLPYIDIYERDQGLLSKDLGYVISSQVHHFSPNKYHFELKASGTNSVLLDIPKVHLQKNRAYLIFLHGFANGDPELMAKVVLAGQT
ncbi:DUF4397 domain-containing protein [Bacillus sp. NPDC093026]|uniref:DUF4397 domain-containing protein n=1 Tax=Bacillus sp. NPDC093026 TaxID=3363948 RepID=UPI0037F27846